MRNIQFFRFVAIGVVNTAFSYSIYAFFVFIGFNYAIANLLALLLGILFSFKTQGRFVFRNSDNRLFWRFFLSWAAIYLVTISVIGQFIAYGIDAYASGALALPFSTALSYLSQKYFVFHAPATSSPPLGKPNSEKLP